MMKIKVDQLLAEANRRIDDLEIDVPANSRGGRYVDLRTFRFYRSQKLIDPPDEKDGTSGLYGELHLLQLLAIKTLQANWVPINEIRRRLENASHNELRQIAGKHYRPSRVSAPARKSSRKRTSNMPRKWVELPLAEGAYAMVEAEFLNSAKPSTLRAIGEQLTAHLLAARG